MRKMKWLSFLGVLSLGFCLSMSVMQAKAETNDFECEYSVGTKSDPFTQYIYGCQEVTLYTQDEATDMGIPEGFSGEVLSVGTGAYSGAINRGLTLDFSSRQIPTHLVKNITFRIYIGGDNNTSDGYPEVRIPHPTINGRWMMRYNVSQMTDQWIEVVLGEDEGTFFNNQGITHGFEDLSVDGYLCKFELAMRHNGSVGIFYIDSVRVNLIENEGVAPVIRYDGEDVVTISQGQTLSFNVSAYDEVDGDVEVEYAWGDPSKVNNGIPDIGTHSLTFTAKDYFGNTAEKSITVIVEEADLGAPTIEIPTDTVYAKIGAKPLIAVTATDDKDANVTVVYTWSEGALNSRGKLTEGTHTLTLTATDSSNNSAEKVITFIVTENGDPTDVIIDEELLCPDDESSDSSSSKEVESSDSSFEDSSVSEESSVPESSSEEVSSSEESSVPEYSSEEGSSSEVSSTPESSSVDSIVSEDNSIPAISSSDVPVDSSEGSASNSDSAKKFGCAGVAGGFATVMLVIVAGGMLGKKKRED